MLSRENIQRLFSPKALVRVLPTLLSLVSELPEFIFFRFSSNKTDWFCLSVLLSGKEENYFNSIGFTLRKLSCLTVLFSRTVYLYECQRTDNLLYNVCGIHPCPQGAGFFAA